MLGINSDSYNVVVWVTPEFSSALDNWRLNRKQHDAAIPYTFESLVEEICKTSMLPNIRDDAITALLQLTQGCMSYATPPTLSSSTTS
jgi:hypothetical protein